MFGTVYTRSMSRRLLPAALAAFVLAACSSSTSHSAGASTSTSGVSTTASSAPAGTGTTAATGTGGAATTSPGATAAPTTKPAATGAQITMSVTDPGVCPATDVSYQPAPLTVRVTWKVTNADSVIIAIDSPGAYESDLPLTGSMDLNWTCPASPHTYYIEAVKNGQVVAQKTKTLSPPT